jgi:hypothetical protein
MEMILLDTMFDYRASKASKRVVISKEVVEGTARPSIFTPIAPGDAGATAEISPSANLPCSMSVTAPKRFRTILRDNVDHSRVA